MNANFAYALLAAGAGACIALQASANAMFRRNLGDPWYAAFFSIVGTMTTAVVLMLLFRPPAPPLESFKSTQWWNWIGGPMGAMIVLAGAALTPKLGAGAFIAFVVGHGDARPDHPAIHRGPDVLVGHRRADHREPDAPPDGERAFHAGGF